MNSDLKEKFLAFINDEELFDLNQTVLLACSGGVDSMVLFHLLLSCDITFHVAHVNYRLRGKHSDADDRFVQSTCQNYFVPFHGKKIMSPPEGNTQEWARDIRFSFFDELAHAHHFDGVLIAQHFDDQIETCLLNFVRGSGLRGLIGIRAKRSHYRRPLLFARKQELLTYAHKFKIAWREDDTNAELYYQRNQIRHSVTPVLDKLRGHDAGMRHSLDHLKNLENWLSNHFDSRLQSFLNEKGEWRIEIDDFRSKTQQFELFQLLRIHEFTADQVDNMINSSRTGSQYKSKTHLAIIDRGTIRIRERIDSVHHEKILHDFNENFRLAIGTLELSFKKVPGNSVERSHTRSYFDLEHVMWPLKIRKWQHGDRFQPFGMYGKTKKISALLVQLRLSHFEKEETLVLLDSNDDILWVIGYRRSVHAPIVEHTQACLRISVIMD